MSKVQLFMQVARHKKICAFCRHWYDPSNSNLRILSGSRVEYETSVMKPCTVKGFNMMASTSCSKFESKL